MLHQIISSFAFIMALVAIVFGGTAIYSMNQEIQNIKQYILRELRREDVDNPIPRH